HRPSRPCSGRVGSRSGRWCRVTRPSGSWTSCGRWALAQSWSPRSTPADCRSRGTMAESDPELPRTFRPYFVRLVVVAAAVLWFAIPAEERARLSGAQSWTLLAVLVGLLGAVYGLGRTRLVADADGLTIVNVFRRHRLAWAQVLAVNLRRGDPWVYLDIDDGTTVAVMAIQSADGARGRRALTELRMLVE